MGDYSQRAPTKLMQSVPQMCVISTHFVPVQNSGSFLRLLQQHRGDLDTREECLSVCPIPISFFFFALLFLIRLRDEFCRTSVVLKIPCICRRLHESK